MANPLFLPLFEKYLSGEISAEELLQLQVLMQVDENQPDLEKLLEDAFANEALAIAGDEDPERMYQAFRERIERKIQGKGQAGGVEGDIGEAPEPEEHEISPGTKVIPFRRRHWRLGAIAAAIVLFLAIGTYLWMNSGRKQEMVHSPVAAVHDIPPGRNRAILTLSDGHQVDLDSAGNGAITLQGASRVVKSNAGQLSYQPLGQGGRQVTYNTISIPRGGTYKLTLSDGTNVWLNATSSLRYPTAFTGKERKVELTGEGYFEVARNAAMPFRVSVSNMVVEVLGTDFNIMAYPDESAVLTTLLEGAVKVNSGKNASLLSPGQQAQLDRSGRISLVQNANTEKAVAWKNNLFLFDNTNIQEAMREVARWYDVDLSYQGEIKGGFHGMISRSANVSELLKMLELTGEAHFKLEGRMVTVMP